MFPSTDYIDEMKLIHDHDQRTKKCPWECPWLAKPADNTLISPEPKTHKGMLKPKQQQTRATTDKYFKLSNKTRRQLVSLSTKQEI